MGATAITAVSRAHRLVAVLVMALAGAGLSGCSIFGWGKAELAPAQAAGSSARDMEAELDRLRSENQQLRDQLAQLRAATQQPSKLVPAAGNDAESRKALAALETLNAEIDAQRKEAERLRADTREAKRKLERIVVKLTKLRNDFNEVVRRLEKDGDR